MEARWRSAPEYGALGVSLLAGAVGGWVLGWALDRALVWFFGVFNAGFQAVTVGYTWIVSVMLRGSIAVLLIYGGLLYLTYYAFDRTPTGFIPSQDKGYLLVNVQMPDSDFGREDAGDHATGRGDRGQGLPREAHRGDRRASRSCSTPTPPTSGRCT